MSLRLTPPKDEARRHALFESKPTYPDTEANRGY